MDGRPPADRRPPDRDADARLVRGRLLHRRARGNGRGVRRVRRDGDRQGALPQRAPAAREKAEAATQARALPRHDEPRDQDADERRDRHDRPPPRHGADARAARVRRGRPLERRRPAPRDRRHPRLLEDRGGQARTREGAGRSPRMRRGRARDRRAACVGEGDRAGLPHRRGRACGIVGTRRACGRCCSTWSRTRSSSPRKARWSSTSTPSRPGRARTASSSPFGIPGSASPRTGWTAVRVLQPGRRLHHAATAVPARARHLEASRGADGRDDVGGERGGQGIDLPCRPPRGGGGGADPEAARSARRSSPASGPRGGRQRHEPRDRRAPRAIVGHGGRGAHVALEALARIEEGEVRRRRPRHGDAGDGRARPRTRSGGIETSASFRW